MYVLKIYKAINTVEELVYQSEMKKIKLVMFSKRVEKEKDF